MRTSIDRLLKLLFSDLSHQKIIDSTTVVSLLPVLYFLLKSTIFSEIKLAIVDSWKFAEKLGSYSLLIVFIFPLIYVIILMGIRVYHDLFLRDRSVGKSTTSFLFISFSIVLAMYVFLIFIELEIFCETKIIQQFKYPFYHKNIDIAVTKCCLLDCNVTYEIWVQNGWIPVMKRTEKIHYNNIDGSAQKFNKFEKKDAIIEFYFTDRVWSYNLKTGESKINHQSVH